MATGAVPVRIRTATHFSSENSHRETSHRGRTFRSPWTFVGVMVSYAMSHAIHKIVSKRRCQSYFISRRSPHHGISKDSDLCASAHRCPHYAYARLIARVIFPLLSHTWARAHGISLPYERLRTQAHRSRNLCLP